MEQYIKEGDRKAIPEMKDYKGKTFARWIVANVSKHIHPDKFKSEGTAAVFKMTEICAVLNKLVNKLKGLTWAKLQMKKLRQRSVLEQIKAQIAAIFSCNWCNDIFKKN